MMNYSKRSDGRRLLVVIALFGILTTYGTSAANDPVTNAAPTEEPAAATTAGDRATTAAGCNSTNTCETCETLWANKNRLSLNVSICQAETGASNTFQYCVTIELHDQRNPSAPKTYTDGSPHNVNCSTVLDPIKEKIRTINNRIRSRPRPSTTADSQVDPSTTSESQVDPSTIADSQVDLSTTSESQVDPSTASESQVDPSTTSESQVDPSTASESQVDPSTAAESQVDHSTAAESQADPSTAAESQADPSTTADSQVDPSTAAESQVDTSTAAESQVDPSTAAESQVDPSTTAESQVDTSTAAEPQVDTSTTAESQVDTSTTTNIPPANRKRRQAVDNDDDVEWDDADIDEFWEFAWNVVKNVTRASGENASPAMESSPALPSSNQSTETFAESSTASGTTSVLDAHRAECGSKEACMCRNTTTRASSADRPQWTISGSVWKADNIYHAEFVFENQRNSSQRRVFKKESPDQLNCTTEVIWIRESIKTFKKNSTAMPLTSPTPTPAPSGPINRKRRQAATSATNDDDIAADFDFEDIDAIMDGFETKDDANFVTNESSKNPTLALQSSPQSTKSLAESNMASDTTSIVLTSTSTVSAKAEDPNAVKEPTQTPGQDVWDAHRGIFLTVAILISVCVVVTAFCCLCMKWRERGGSRNPEKHPIAMEEAREAPTAVSNPITDREMIQDEAPMQERENPAVTPNGGGQHISKADEDNGWVVPLDELSNAEKEKPEVENTRL